MRASRACSAIRASPNPAPAVQGVGEAGLGLDGDRRHGFARVGLHVWRCRCRPHGGSQRVHGMGNLPDVVGRRAAATADQPDARPDEPPGVGRHVVRRAEIQVAAVDVARLAGVGHRGQQGTRHRLGEAFDGVEHRGGADAAVDPEHVGAKLHQLRPELLHRRAVQGVAILGGGQHRDDRPIAHTADGPDRRADLVDVAEGLEDEQVHAAVGQAAGLFGEDDFGLVQPRLAPRLDTDAQRPHRAGHPRGIARRVTRNARPGDVDGVDLLGQAEARELEPVGPEGVGLDDLRARAKVGLMDVDHQAALRQVQILEGAIEEDALGVELSAHGAIADEHPIAQGVEKGLGHECVITCGRPARPPGQASERGGHPCPTRSRPCCTRPTRSPCP
jgi:hypothetical protein